MFDIDIPYHYILDEQGNPVPEPDLRKWGEWFGDPVKRRVQWTFFCGEAIHVSTVFLGLVHISLDPEETRPMLYETMVFAEEEILARLQEISETDDRSIMALFVEALGGKYHPEIQIRYATRQEAEQGHKTMCEFIETCLTKGLLPIKTK